MRQKQRVFSLFLLSPSSRRVWIEILDEAKGAETVESPSSRRVWIEMLVCKYLFDSLSVALLAEGVDRNIF